MSKWVQNFFRVLQNFYHHVFMLYEDLFGTDVIMVCLSLSHKTVDILFLCPIATESWTVVFGLF